jgi:hypothetical protein
MRIVMMKQEVDSGVQQKTRGDGFENVVSQQQSQAQHGRDEGKGMQTVDDRLDGGNEVVVPPDLGFRDTHHELLVDVEEENRSVGQYRAGDDGP